jgi:hypothetical protein
MMAKEAVIWTNRTTHEVMVAPRERGVPTGGRSYWGDPIGANYAQWQEMHNALRVQLMLETAIDLAMQEGRGADRLPPHHAHLVAWWLS